MGRARRPPPLARALLAALLPDRYRQHQLGDLEEEFRERLDSDGARRARRWYRRQVAASLVGALGLRLRARRDDRSKGAGMDVWSQHLKHAYRSLAAHPLYALVATLTLAMGIGVNTAIFSLASQVLFIDLPMQDADELAWVWTLNQEAAGDIMPLSVPDFEDVRERSRSFEALAAFVQRPAILTGLDRPERIIVAQATANLFDVWRTSPVLGRGFLPDEGAPGATPVAVLSHRTWEERMGSDPGVLGTTIRLDGVAHTVVGVGNERMDVGNLGRAMVWTPLRDARAGEPREAREAIVTGRLRPGVSLGDAATEVAAIGRALQIENPASNRGWVLQVRTTDDSLIGDEAAAILVLLAVVVGLVLMIACANVANLVLVRAAGRARELAVRTALGARRTRVITQLLTENLLMALAAGAIGLALAKGLLAMLVRVSRGREVLFTMSTIDGRVLAFTLVVSLLTPVLFGLLPALAATRSDAASALREGGARAGGGRRTHRVRGALVGAQIAVAMALMVGSGLAVRSIIELQRLDWGFDPEGMLSLVVDLPEAAYPPDEARTFFRELERRIDGLSGVADAALASARPGPGVAGGSPFAIEGRPRGNAGDLPTAFLTVITPGYFETMGIPMTGGRAFTASDTEDQPRVAIVNVAAAERFWPDRDPVGQRVRVGVDESAPWCTVVGVTTGTAAGSDLDDLRAPQIFLPFAQEPVRSMVVLARARGDAAALSAPIRQEVWALDPEQPVGDVRTMDAYLYDANGTGYALISLFVTFAAFALVMATMGIYGVMSYVVSLRTSELSLRMALGAERSDVMRMILTQAGRLVLFGGAAGMAGGWVISRLLAGFVYGISPSDPLTFVGVPLLLAAVALLASYVPARRATRIEPMGAMRAG